MIKHDLIEQVGGIEKARAIVEGATFGTHYRVDTGRIIYCPNENHFFFADQIKLGVEFIRIDDLRTAIAQHESNNHQKATHCNNCENCRRKNDFQVGDQIRYMGLGGESSHPEIFEVVGFDSNAGGCGYKVKNELGQVNFIFGDNFLKLDDSKTDCVTDITNHISPNTKVVEA